MISATAEAARTRHLSLSLPLSFDRKLQLKQPLNGRTGGRGTGKVDVRRRMEALRASYGSSSEDSDDDSSLERGKKEAAVTPTLPEPQCLPPPPLDLLEPPGQMFSFN